MILFPFSKIHPLEVFVSVLYIIYFFKFILYWSIVELQCCVHCCCTGKWLSYIYCCFSVGKLCPALFDPMDCQKPGFPVLHHLLEYAKTHVHCVGDAIQPSHPLMPPSPHALTLSQHQGFFQWVSSLQQVAKVLELHLQYQSFWWIFRIDFLLGLTGLISLLFKGLSRVFCSTTVRNHQFFSAQPSFWSNTHTWLLFWSIPMHDYWKNHIFD